MYQNPKYVKVITHVQSKLLFSANINDKRTILTFLNHESCYNCITYLNKYKNRYNKMPNYKPGIYSEKYKNDVSKPLFVSNKSLLDLQYKCFNNRIGLVGVAEFNYSYENNIIITKFSAYDFFDDTEYSYKNENYNISDNMLSLNDMIF